MTDGDKDHYKVGYRKPPKTAQFKPGKSGNLKGRPKGSRSKATIVEEEIEALVAITENGRKKKISMWRAAFKQQMRKAAAGDRHSFKVVEEICERLCKKRGIDTSPGPEENAPSSQFLTIEDAEKAYRDALKNAKSSK